MDPTGRARRSLSERQTDYLDFYAIWREAKKATYLSYFFEIKNKNVNDGRAVIIKVMESLDIVFFGKTI